MVSDNKKSILMLASVASMIDCFNMRNIDILMSLGYQVEVACNFQKESTCSAERVNDLKKRLDGMGVEYHQIDFTRKVMNLPQDWKAYKQVKKLVKEKKYSFIHCHSPIGGVVGRMVAHDAGIKVIYTAHGFHFFDGCPLKNWMIYYPIEKFFSRWTDVIITINREDYNRAKKKFYAKKIIYIPGVGVDTDKFKGILSEEQKVEKKKSLHIPENSLMITSVGELNKNKNQQIVIRAIHKLHNPNVHYVVVGTGSKEIELKKLAYQLKVNDQVHFLGYRNDVAELYKCSDICILSSIREGLAVASVEGMATGLPLIISDNRSSRDLARDNKNAFVCKYDNVEEFKNAIQKLLNSKLRKRMGSLNSDRAEKFSARKVDELMKKVYSEIIQ